MLYHRTWYMMITTRCCVVFGDKWYWMMPCKICKARHIHSCRSRSIATALDIPWPGCRGQFPGAFKAEDAGPKPSDRRWLGKQHQKKNQTTWGQIWDIILMICVYIYIHNAYSFYIMNVQSRSVWTAAFTRLAVLSCICPLFAVSSENIQRWTWKLHWKKPSKSLGQRWSLGATLCWLTVQNQDSVMVPNNGGIQNKTGHHL